MTKSKIIKILLLTICCILIILTLGTKLTYISSDDGVINTNIITVVNSIPGNVSFSSDIRPGTTIRKGEIIFTVDNGRYGNIESVAQYYGLKNQINLLTADRKSLEIELVQLRKDYDRFASLVVKNSATIEQLEHIKTNLDRVVSLIKVKKQHEQEVYEDLSDIQDQLRLFKKEEGRSSCNGVIWSVIARSGEYKQSGSSLFEIINEGDIWVDAYFSEKYADYLKPQVPVTIRVVASGEELEGKILFVRAGAGRIAFNSPIQMPPESFQKRRIVARISIETPTGFSAKEFYGIGYSVRAMIKR